MLLVSLYTFMLQWVLHQSNKNPSKWSICWTAHERGCVLPSRLVSDLNSDNTSVMQTHAHFKTKTMFPHFSCLQFQDRYPDKFSLMCLGKCESQYKLCVYVSACLVVVSCFLQAVAICRDLQQQRSWMQRVNPARSRAVFYFCTLPPHQTLTLRHTRHTTKLTWPVACSRMDHHQAQFPLPAHLFTYNFTKCDIERERVCVEEL